MNGTTHYLLRPFFLPVLVLAAGLAAFFTAGFAAFFAGLAAGFFFAAALAVFDPPPAFVAPRLEDADAS